MYNGETGELMKEIPLTKLYRFSRLKARALLSEGLDIQVTSSLLPSLHHSSRLTFPSSPKPSRQSPPHAPLPLS
jgi:hypothetical protein